MISRMVCVGELAAHRLQQGPLSVVTVFERSVYAQTPQGTLVCLCQGDLEPGPLNILCEPWILTQQRLKEGDCLQCLEAGKIPETANMSEIIKNNLHGPEGLRVLFHTAQVWKPEPLFPHSFHEFVHDPVHELVHEPALAPVSISSSGLSPSPVQESQLAQGLRRLKKLLPLLGPTEGLAPLLMPFMAEARPGTKREARPVFTPLGQDVTVAHTLPRLTMRDALRMQGRVGLEHLQTWLGTGANESLCEAVKGLLGLGPGLTPSGDDVLGGALVTLRALGCCDQAQILADNVLQWGPTRTNRISMAHLEAAAAGTGARALHNALQCLFWNTPGLEEAVAGLNRIGHSSGWDAFTGVVLVLQASPFRTFTH